MSKSTLFFSHSSKDKEIVLSIKNKLDMMTGGVMEIFMSSDGQSIPFGTNWIHKIEEGLQIAKIMFVFVTKNSISSGWIYFEAGYAYSKGIQVIPVGIGVDIGSLKAPLNLLQGFNITSKDSLNNFIAIINRTFDYHFKNEFDDNDYLEVVQKFSTEAIDTVTFEEVIDKAECVIDGEQTINGKGVKYNIDKFFNEIVTYLEDNNIDFSKEDGYGSVRNICLVANGVKILYRQENQASVSPFVSDKDCAKIIFYISAYNFPTAFTLFKNLLHLFEDKNLGYIRLHLKDKFSYTITAEDGSSIISKHPEFNIQKDHIGGYICDKLELQFYIFNYYSYLSNKATDYVASVTFDQDKVHAEDIVELVNKLVAIKFIFRK